MIPIIHIKLAITFYNIFLRSLHLPVLDASRIPKGLQSFMNEDNLLDLAHNSIMTESEDTSTTLPSKRRVSSVKARK